MEDDEAITRMAALATPSRLAVLKFLAKEGGEDGLTPGDLARRLNLRPNSLSTQLLLLSNARLVRSRREGRNMIYSVNLDALKELSLFVAEDCSDGRINAKLKIATRP